MHDLRDPPMAYVLDERDVEAANAAPDDAGDILTWTAIDDDSRLIVSYLVGGRHAGHAHEFMQDVASRPASRVQLTTGWAQGLP